jgi:8-oxo-dGTP pyrophosphatase MutT (NUDIX family)
VEFLTAYQDAAYAAQYQAFVEKVRQRRGAAGQDHADRSVARYLFKLMAYKDEYEVARLHTDTAFLDKINGMFEGDFKLNYHMAPPLIAKKNAKGELIKQPFGPAMMTAFKLLARLKGLRGGAFDIFGKTEERKTERALIGEYRASIEEVLRAAGLIAGWRDETIPLLDPATGQALATLERAAARFWGTPDASAPIATGWVSRRSRRSRPAALWIARRALSKATDPGLYDNLVGGGVPAGQTPLSTLEREAWEEAGLPRDRWRQLSPGRTIALERDVPEGLQREWLHSWDIELHPEDEPRNQDGEVESFTLLPVAQALATWRPAAR